MVVVLVMFITELEGIEVEGAAEERMVRAIEACVTLGPVTLAMKELAIEGTCQF